MADRFPSPFEIQTPPGAEGWRELYTYSSLFSEDRREYEDGAFWFHDGVHWPEAMTPWDTTFLEYAIASLSQYNTRHYLIPPALGIDYRILNGYVYLSPVPAPPDEIEGRVPHFMERAGFYFGNWDRLYDEWLVKIRDLVKEMSELQFAPLPVMEDLEVVTSGAGKGSGNELLAGYHRLLDLGLTLWQYHFEFLNLGYAAYLDFFGFCKAAFPSISDLAIAKMVAGVDVDLFRPDDELKRLARLAVSSGIDDRFTGGDVSQVFSALEADEGGLAWIAEWDKAAEPWFNFSTGSGFYHSDKIWIENHEVPIGYITDYIAKVKQGADLDRPVAALQAERDRVVSEYRDLLDSDDDRATFDAKLGLSRTVFPYVENHNFYVEHWAHSVLWRKMRDLGGVLAAAGFSPRPTMSSCSAGPSCPTCSGTSTPRGPSGPRPRALVLAGGGRAPPRHPPGAEVLVGPPGAGRAAGGRHRAVHDHAVGDHVRLRRRMAQRRRGRHRGRPERVAASPASWRARPGSSSPPTRSARSRTARSSSHRSRPRQWAPIFGKIKATVTDVGGMMSHAAIVCREYGLPAVTGTAFGTTTIKTGQLLRVDGNTGKVTILD